MDNKAVAIITEQENFDYYRAIPLWGARVGFLPLDCSLRVIEELPDMFLIDCGFDVDRGLYLLRRIKAIRQEIMVIFVTDERSADPVIQAFRIGARDYFRKPIDLFKLKEVIETLLEIKAMPNEKRAYHEIIDAEMDADPLTVKRHPS